jgi:hypothetical protein
MGKQAKQMKRESFGGSGNKGPSSKANRRSLKFASHERKRTEMAQKCTQERNRGRTRNRMQTGRIERRRRTPLESLDDM